METLETELSKVISQSNATFKAQTTTIDAYISHLEQLRARLTKEEEKDDDMQLDPISVSDLHAKSNAALQDASKEYYNVLNKGFTKAVEKKFTADIRPLLPAIPEGTTDPFQHMYFADDNANVLIERVVADYLTREGKEDLARQFAEEAGIDFPQETLDNFSELHEVLADMQKGDMNSAIIWARDNANYLKSISSPLEFHLRRSQYISLLTSDSIPLPLSIPRPAQLPGTISSGSSPLRGPALAVAYGRSNLVNFFPQHEKEIARLFSAAIFLPLHRLLTSSYKDIFLPYPDMKVDSTYPYLPDNLHQNHLIPLFTSAFCSLHNLPREHGLKILTDLGGGGALSKLAKCISVASAKRTNWSTTSELPIELPPPLPDYRFHSIFSCPVSKEHAGCDESAGGEEEEDGKEQQGNWPMMLPCGHVIARDTLNKLAKGGQKNVKCPYCPAQSTVYKALRVYF